MKYLQVIVLLAAGALSAPGVNAQGADARQPVTAAQLGSNATSAAEFSVGLTRDNGITWRTEARAADNIRIVGTVSPEPLHSGQRGDVFVLVQVGGTVLMINSQKQLVAWDGSVAGLAPMFDDVMLEQDMQFDVFSGVVGAPGTYPFYVGYTVAGSSALYYTPTPQSLTLTNAVAPSQSHACSAYGGRTVQVGYTSSAGIFTHTPFHAADLALITNGQETNDPRFSYQWIKNQGQAVPIYAPADGVLVRIRHKAENLPEFPSDDYDLIFLVACDPTRPGQRDTIVRFNHITDPRPDIKAAFAFGSLGAPTFNPFTEHEERQVPLVNIAVKAGDYIGSTRGTPLARNFDFEIGVNDATVCPFSVLEEPHKTQLLSLLGPQSASPTGPGTPGYACTGYGSRP